MLVGMQMWQFKRKIHPSWLIAMQSAAIVVGVALVSLINQSVFSSSLWLAIAMVLSVFAFWKRMLIFIPIVLICGLMIGFWRGSLLSSQLAVYQNLIGSAVTVSGSVVDDPDSGAQRGLVLRIGDIISKEHTLPGTIWVSSMQVKDVKRGDIVTVSAKLSKGFGSFAAVMYDAKIITIMRPQPGDIARQARDWFADKVRLAISEPEVSLGLGYLVGQKSALTPELQQALVATGLTHVVVASGYNLTILVRLARRLFARVSKYLATLVSGSMVIAFMAVTGASPSMSRAGLVSGLSLAAWYYGRKFHPLVLLPFAAAITTLINPTYAWNDLGWQLSFLAFGGVMLLAPLLQAYFFGGKKPGIIRQILGETISAHVVTLPILVLAFGQFSNVAIIANLLVLPLVPLAMLLTFIAGIGSIIMPGLAHIIGLPAQWLLDYMVGVINYFASLGWSQTNLVITPFIAIGAHLIIVVVCFYLWRATKLNLRETNVVE